MPGPKSVQITVQLSDDRCTVTDRSGHALHRTRANVADRENSGQGGLERQRSSRGTFGGKGRRRVAGSHEPLGVHAHSALSKPVGVRHRADEQEYVAYGAPLLFSARPMAPANRLQTFGRLPDQLSELSLGMYFDVA